MLGITYFQSNDHNKIMDNYGGNTGQLDWKNNISNLQTLSIELKMALIPNGGKLHTKSAVQRALEVEA